jgi:hypothetical protein
VEIKLFLKKMLDVIKYLKNIRADMKNIKLSSIFVLLISSYGAHASSIWLENSSKKLSSKDIERVSYAMSLKRPPCPINGEPEPDCSGICFGKKIFCIHDTSLKRTVVRALTEQDKNLDLDVLENLTITIENFNDLKATLEKNGIVGDYSLKFGKEGPVLNGVNSSVLVILVQELGKFFGLSIEEILEKINSLQESASTE